MKKHSIIQRMLVILLAVTLFSTTLIHNSHSAKAGGISFILLSRYRNTVNIKQSFYLIAITSTGKKPTWKSSDSKVASVNTYGQVTGKRAGTCKITAKIRGAEASCTVTVCKTTIRLSAKTVSMENGACFRLSGTTSNGSPLKWKSSKRSVAQISDTGVIQALKPGETRITASADGSEQTCMVTVKKPKVTLSHTSASLYRKQSLQLSAKVSSGRMPVWKSKKTSVATINEKGLVTARKHGTAMITATVDGVTRTCELTVRSPEIRLNTDSLTMKKRKKTRLTAKVSSGNAPVWKTSKKSVAVVDQNGLVTAKKKGKCYIYVSEDGTKEQCHIQVK